jgi:hypothetical protein
MLVMLRSLAGTDGLTRGDPRARPAAAPPAHWQSLAEAGFKLPGRARFLGQAKAARASLVPARAGPLPRRASLRDLSGSRPGRRTPAGARRAGPGTLGLKLASPGAVPVGTVCCQCPPSQPGPLPGSSRGHWQPEVRPGPGASVATATATARRDWHH